MARTDTQKTIENYFEYFNASNMDQLFSLVSDDVTVEMNHIKVVSDKDGYKKYLTTNKKHYDEHTQDFEIMISEDGRHVAVKFKVKGKYIQTDDSLIPAKGQAYELAVLNYFELKNGKIQKACCYFNDNDFIRQVS